MMRTFKILLCWLLFVFSGMAAGQDAPPAPTQQYTDMVTRYAAQNSGFGVNTGYGYESAISACTAMAGLVNAKLATQPNPDSMGISSASGTVCWGTWASGGNVSNMGNYTSKLTCPDGYTQATTTQCVKSVCPSGYEVVGDTCQRVCQSGPAPTTASGEGGSYSSTGGIVAGSTYCDNGCTAKGVNSGSICVTVNGQKSCTSFFSGASYTGGACTSNTNSSSDVPVCGPGQVMGQVNGKTVCLAGGSGSGSPSSTPGGTSPSGQSTSSSGSTTTRTNEDGSTTKTETTTKTTKTGTGVETETTTKQTTTYPDGHSEVTESTTKEGDANTDKQQKDLCEKNPGLTICQNSTIGGDCETTVCTGDAITCAIAQAARTANCKRRDAEDTMKNSAAYTLGNAVLSGNDPAQNLPTRSNAQTISLNNLDSSGWLGGGSCFPDKSFTVQGHTVAIPFSSVCDYLVGLRYAMMVLAGLLAFKILAGTILKD